MANLNKANLKNLVVAVGAVLSSSVLQAADKELLDVLLGNGAISQQQYDELLAKEALTVEDANDIVVDFGAGSGVNVSTRDGDFEFEIGGRLHLDYAQHEHVPGLPVTPINGFTTRRARLEMDGRFDGVWGWAAEIDFAENVVELKDFKIGYEGDNFSLYGGHQKQPYSLSLEMSSNDIPWIERSIDNYLVAELTDRSVGVRLETSGDNWFFAGGVFGEEPDSGTQGDEFVATMARFVYAPIMDNDRTLHLGLRGAFRDNKDIREFRARDRTTDFSGLRIVDTGVIADAESISMFGPELGLAVGPLTVLGEYSAVTVSRSLNPDVDLNAWHLGAALSLTGDTRATSYRIDAGEFKGVRASQPFDPASGQWGGIELVARYAAVDFNDGAFVGGTEDVFNAGVNWYPTRNIRFLFDWTHILDTDKSNTVRTFAPDLDVWTVRAQYNY
jgi:phosphate-selective porin OprO/OprP